MVGAMAASVAPARALDRLCDPANEDCRAVLISLIRNERVGIDVGFWFMEDARYTAELIKRFQAGVPVRVLMDPRANSSYPHNALRLAELQAAGIPMRKRIGGGILHYKMMLFSGQNTVEFSGANYSADAFTFTTAPYTNYTDESIYFTDDPDVVGSFRTRFDDLWVNTTLYANHANITTPLIRLHDIFPKDPELNFPPVESYAARAVARYRQESSRIDVIMYRITDRRHTDALVAARARGVAVRLITEPQQYRDVSRLWHAWNVDRLYMAGVQIKHRAHAGLNHQKSVLLYGQRLAIFGSSNWTSPSDNSQEEHNYFTTKPALFQWLSDQFSRKWNNSAGVVENVDFTPLPPDTPKSPLPLAGAIVSGTSVTLEWYAGPWAHKYDIYFGTTATPPLVAQDVELGPSQTTSQKQKFTVPTPLAQGTTYYWRVVSKTMANMARNSPVWSFSTAGTTPPPAPTQPGAGDVVIYAADATTLRGWQVTSDATAAGGRRIWNPDANAAKITAASAAPANYFEMTFNAQAGRPYRLWLRLKAESNGYANDSVFVQFAGAVNSSGTPIWRIGTTAAAEVVLEDCSGCGVAGWGWQDNGYGAGVLGPVVYFATSGTQRIRIQQREDGVSIDQIVLSPSAFLSSSPGALKNDTVILRR
jgi:phosphatidylserine/phosphatidylglycerophosphate/cardiolipin synthase-like enzyme